MILINGNFLCRNLTGIERFAWEVCSKMDQILDKNDDIRLLVPANAKKIPDLKKIKIEKSTKQIKSFPIWDMWTFALACKKFKATALNFSNTAPLGKLCGLSFLHDIYAKAYPKDFVSLKDRLIKIYSLFSYHNIAKNAKIVLTVSEFAKNEIQKAYKVQDKRIKVIPNGWDHFKDLQADDKIFEKFGQLKSKEFYFTLGSLSKRKNLKWIAEYAKKHEDETFAVSGKAISGLVPPELEALKNLKNVVLLGYVTDGEVKALMKKCKAFVFPSYYEGFGIPPLEALSCGTKVVVSNRASLPEIYKDSAFYIDADSTNCNLAKLLEKKVDSPQKILENYTYENATKKLLEAIKSL